MMKIIYLLQLHVQQVICNLNSLSVLKFIESSYCRFWGGAWISLIIGGGGWDVLVRGNLTRREDTGQINSSPVSVMSPILRLQYGCRHVIRIPGEHTFLMQV